MNLRGVHGPLGLNATILYGIMTSSAPVYQAQLAAVLDTWAAPPLREGRVFAVVGTLAKTGAPASAAAAHPGVPMAPPVCEDSYDGVTCKEEQLLQVAYGEGAQWLVVVGEDNYVDVPRMEAYLANRTEPGPHVIGVLGCGAKRADLRSCPQVKARGGLCGGGGYMINAAALAALFADGTSRVKAYYESVAGSYGDMTTSCAFMQRGVEPEAATAGGAPAWEGVETEGALRRMVQEVHPMTYHYVAPEVMRWLHAAVDGGGSLGRDLQASAFTADGCVVGPPKLRDHCKQEALKADDVHVAMLDLFPDLESHRLQHVARRSAQMAAAPGGSA